MGVSLVTYTRIMMMCGIVYIIILTFISLRVLCLSLCVCECIFDLFFKLW